MEYQQLFEHEIHNGSWRFKVKEANHTQEIREKYFYFHSLVKKKADGLWRSEVVLSNSSPRIESKDSNDARTDFQCRMSTMCEACSSF